MVAKTCPNCGRRSYSAAAEGRWLCPHCYEDLSAVPAERPAVDKPDLVVDQWRSYSKIDPAAGRSSVEIVVTTAR